MLADYAGIDVPCFLLLNMADVASDQGKKIDALAIEEKLGIPVVPFSATDIKSYDTFYKTLEKALSKNAKINADNLAMLLLLTISDICAVAPNVWSDWKYALFKELYQSTFALLKGEKIRIKNDQFNYSC